MQFDLRQQYEISPMRDQIPFEEFERRWNSEEPPQQEGGVLNTIGALGSSFVEGVEQVAPAFARDLRGSDIPHPSERGLMDNYIIKSRQDALQHMQEYKGQGVAEDIAQTPESLGFSGAAGITGLVAGGAGLALSGGNPVAAGAAGGVASGATAYRIAKDMFMEEALNQFNEDSLQDRGHGLSKEEWGNAKANLDSLATEHGLWEALPEAIGNVAGAGIIFAPAKKVLGEKLASNIVARVMGKGAELFGTEIATEAVTQQGQHNLAVDAGLQEGEHRGLADFGESVKEVAPQTILQTAMMGGMGSSVKGLAKLGAKKGLSKPLNTEETVFDPNKAADLTGGNVENTPQDVSVKETTAPAQTEFATTDLLTQPSWRPEHNTHVKPFLQHEQEKQQVAANAQALDEEWNLHEQKRADAQAQAERDSFIQSIPEEQRFDSSNPLGHLQASPEQQLRISQEEAMLETRGLPMPTNVVNGAQTVDYTFVPPTEQAQHIYTPVEDRQRLPAGQGLNPIPMPDQSSGAPIAAHAESETVFDEPVIVPPTQALPEGQGITPPIPWVGGKQGLSYTPKSSKEIAAVAHEAAESPKNGLTKPTEAQKEAGNYKLGHVKIGPFDISIENPHGSKRTGTDPDGKKWSQKMHGHYGYIKGTMGNDKDHMDVFIKNGVSEDNLLNKPIFVVEQVDPKTGEFDEHKIVMGAGTMTEAATLYHSNYEKNWGGLGDMHEFTAGEFKQWVTEQSMAYKQEHVASNDVADRNLEETSQQEEASSKVISRPAVKASVVDGDKTLIGSNSDGKKVWQDDNGVRHVDEGVAYVAQSVRTSPKGSSFDSPQILFENGKHEFLTTDELDKFKSEKPSAESKHDMQVKASSLEQHFADRLLSGHSYKSITEARKDASEYSGGKVEAGTTQAKDVDEAIERGVVTAARQLVEEGKKAGLTPEEIFDSLSELISRQPNLSTRTSTSIEMQAYSTPAPIAYLVSHIAEVSAQTTVYEPSAGNGMLLLETAKGNAYVNELWDKRADALKAAGFSHVTRQDGAIHTTKEPVDVVLANPPFGRVKDAKGETRHFPIAEGKTTPEVDHAIVLNSLRSLKKGGTGVFIIGGKKGHTEKDRALKYRSGAQVAFYKALSSGYSIVDHFTLDGKLYAKQGAAYPIDILVVRNTGATKDFVFPAANLPPILTSLEEVKEKLDHVRNRRDEIEADNEDRAAALRLSGEPVQGVSKSDNVSSKGQNRSEELSGATRDHGVQSAPPNVHGGRRNESSGNIERDVRSDARSGDTNSTRPESRPSSAAPSDRVRQSVGSVHDESQRGDAAVSDERHSLAETRRHEGVRGQDRDAGGKGSASVEPRNGSVKEDKTDFQTTYTPTSAMQSMDVYIPNNLKDATYRALSALKEKYGSVDSFVAKNLGYKEQELSRYFAAEQVDAIALAVDNLEHGKGFVIGDQTGIGKGRVNAAIIRYARRKGLVPVFVSKDNGLYTDMGRDLHDIGETENNVLTTNNNKEGSFAFPNGSLVPSMSDKRKYAAFDDFINGDADYDAVFTTYSQLNSVKGKDTPRRELLRSIAPRALFILDESHMAGGSASGGKVKAKAGQADNTATFVRKLLAESPQGTFYSSATYAKTPHVMDLYSKTDMAKAVDNVDQLGQSISKGGVPMQQVIAGMLSRAGQYLRRERPYKGVTFETKTVAVDHSDAEKMASIMRGIMDFDRVKKDAVEQVDEEMAAVGASVRTDNATGDAGASSTNFTALMHNVIAQTLMAQKVQPCIDETVASLKAGQKVVVAVDNTMGSFIKDFADLNGYGMGEAPDLSFKDVFYKYLERSREIRLKDGDETRVEVLTDDQLGADGVAAYENAERLIQESTFDNLPISPIDYFLNGVQQAGFTAEEITGRTIGIDYGDGGKLYSRKKPETPHVSARFNKGETDVIILNSSGSTGISLHSYKGFEDQRQRKMVILQPSLDINTFMQTLGRVFRTGQVNLPEFSLLTLDLPAEKRPNAVLGKKMASLNANTTGGRDSDVSGASEDFFNEVGDLVARSFLTDNPDIDYALGGLADYKPQEPGGLIRRVTGRLPALRVADQVSFYEQFEQAFAAQLEQEERAGGSQREAKTLPLDAKEVTTHVLREKTGDSEFEKEAQLTLYNVKRLGKPFSSEQLTERIAKTVGSEVESFSHISVAGDAFNEGVLEMVRREATSYLKTAKQKAKTLDASKAYEDRITGQYETVRNVLTSFGVGTPVTVTIRDETHQGIVYDTRRAAGAKGSPVAPSRWTLSIATTDATRSLSIPFSAINKPQDQGGVSVNNWHAHSASSLASQYDSGQKEVRERRYIATGNILSAYEDLHNKGQIIRFEDEKGVLQDGILLPATFDASTFFTHRDRALRSIDTVKEYFARADSSAMISLTDDTVKVLRQWGEYRILVPKSKAKGGRWFLDKELLQKAGKEFASAGQSMRMDVDERHMLDVVQHVIDQGYTFMAKTNKDVADDIIESRNEAPEQALSLRPENVSSGVTAKAVTDAINIIPDTPNALPVTVLQSERDLPAHILDGLKGSTGVRGVFDDVAGTVYLVADNLNSAEEAKAIWMHEQVGHHGLRGIMNDIERAQLLNQVALVAGKDLQPIAQRYNFDLNDKAQRQQAAEEYLAQAAEQLTLDESLTGKAKRAWAKLVTAMQKVLSKLGIVNAPNTLIEDVLANSVTYLKGLSDQRVLTHDGQRYSLTPQIALRHPSLARVRDLLGINVEESEVRDLIDSGDMTSVQAGFGLPHWSAKLHAGFKKVYDVQLTRSERRNRMFQESVDEVSTLMNGKLSEEQEQELADFVWKWDGKQIEELNGHKKLITEDGELIVNPEWQKGYEAWLSRRRLSSEVKEAMLELRSSLDADLIRAYNSMNRIDGINKSDLEAYLSEMGQQHNYFPHHRYGDYYVQGRKQNADGKYETIYRAHFDAATDDLARAEAQGKLSELKRQHPDTEWTLGKNEQLSPDVFGAPIDPQAMTQIIAAAADRIGDSDHAKEVQKQLSKAVSDVIKTRGWAAHSIKRQDIEGFEKENLRRVLYDYKQGLTGWISKMEASSEFTKALGDIDAKKHPREYSYASTYVEDMMRTADSIDRATGRIKGVAFAWYLGANVKTAALNLTQNIITGVPRLSMHIDGGTGFWKAAMETLVGQVSGKNTMTDDEQQLLRELYDEDVITEGYLNEIRGKLKDSRLEKGWQKFIQVLGMPMAVAERFNRASLALAAYRAARVGKVKGQDAMDYDAAKKFADQIVRDAHFVYGKTNQPQAIRHSKAGRAASPVYTFRTFSHNLLLLWNQMARHEGKEGKIALAKSIGATAALGGVTALPMYATAMAITQLVSGSDDDWTEEIRKALPQSDLMRDMAVFGLPAGLGVTLGGSLGVEMPVAPRITAQSTPQTAIADNLGDILGIPWDLFVKKPTRIMTALENENELRAVEEALPTVLKNIMQAYRLWNEGQTSLRGTPIEGERLSAMEAFARGIGFQPTSSTKQWQQFAATKRSMAIRTVQANKIAAKIVEAIKGRDYAAQKAAQAEWQAWNEKAQQDNKPWLIVTSEDIKRRLKGRMKSKRPSKREMIRKNAMRDVY